MATFYYCSSQHYINGVWGRPLLETQGNLGEYIAVEEDNVAYWDCQVSLLHANSTETPLHEGWIAQSYRNQNGQGLQSITWTPLRTNISPTDALKIVERVSVGSSIATRTFITEQLNFNRLQNTQWTFYRWTKFTDLYDSVLAEFYYGSTTYNSRIEGITLDDNLDREGTVEVIGIGDVEVTGKRDIWGWQPTAMTATQIIVESFWQPLSMTAEEAAPVNGTPTVLLRGAAELVADGFAVLLHGEVEEIFPTGGTVTVECIGDAEVIGQKGARGIIDVVGIGDAEVTSSTHINSPPISVDGIGNVTVSGYSSEKPILSVLLRGQVDEEPEVTVTSEVATYKAAAGTVDVAGIGVAEVSGQAEEAADHREGTVDIAGLALAEITGHKGARAAVDVIAIGGAEITGLALEGDNRAGQVDVVGIDDVEVTVITGRFGAVDVVAVGDVIISKADTPGTPGTPSQIFVLPRERDFVLPVESDFVLPKERDFRVRP